MVAQKLQVYDQKEKGGDALAISAPARMALGEGPGETHKTRNLKSSTLRSPRLTRTNRVSDIAGCETQNLRNRVPGSANFPSET
jgi:hypothetical protein